MKIALPVFDRSAMRYIIPLRGTSYTIRFKFNDMDKSWYLSFYSADLMSPVVAGLRLVYGINLLKQFQHKIKGSLIVREQKNSDGSKPGRKDFGTLSGLIIEYDDFL